LPNSLNRWARHLLKQLGFAVTSNLESQIARNNDPV
jgi:hypothetical protein